MRDTTGFATATPDEQAGPRGLRLALQGSLRWQYRLLTLGWILLVAGPSTARILTWVCPNGLLSEQGGVAAVLRWIVEKLVLTVLVALVLDSLARVLFALDAAYVIVRLSRVAPVSKINILPAFMVMLAGPEIAVFFCMIRPETTLIGGIYRFGPVVLAALVIHLLTMRSLRSKLDFG